jgi:hypothetical protein
MNRPMNRPINRPMTVCLLLGLVACGKEVPLGAGAGGPADASSVSDGAPKIDLAADLGPQPQNACTAAGGRCLPLGAVCNTPGDPNLMGACGDPASFRCCMEVRGGGDGSVDLLVGGTEPLCTGQSGTGGAAGAGDVGGVGGRCGDAGTDLSAGQ